MTEPQAAERDWERRWRRSYTASCIVVAGGVGIAIGLTTVYWFGIIVAALGAVIGIATAPLSRRISHTIHEVVGRRTA